GRFRVAEFIKRLYNEDRGEVIRNFTEEEIFHLQCFFKKLELTFETNPQYIRTYKSIQSILAGGKRTIACPYQSKGLVMDSRGDIHYCAPKSGNLGSSLKNSALDLFNSNLDERQRLLNENCDDCVHDYHAPITYDEYVKEENQTYWRNFFKLKHLRKARWLYTRLRFGKFPKSDRKTIYVTGWYGTETVGDKAILGHILDYYVDKYDNPKFYVSSMHPFLTEKTMRELGVEAEVVFTDSFDFAKTAAFADITVMGGGPLMDMGSLAIPLWAFKIAKHFKKETIIFGCGLGPLKQPKFINTVKELIKLSDQVWLRDSNSVTLSSEFTDRDDVKLFGD
ncbi:MAG: polysaccharide pyruvyl transferase family protein, partial [Marinoscillum sp.]